MNKIEDYILYSSDIIKTLMNQQTVIQKIIEDCVDIIQRGGILYTLGNGGSAAEASHFTAELVGGFRNHKRNPIASICLNTDTTTLTAIGNDYGYTQIFSRVVEANVTSKDGLIMFSTSGNSENIIEASCKTSAYKIGLTGRFGGELKKYCNLWLGVESFSTPHIQEAHQVLVHLIAEGIEANV